MNRAHSLRRRFSLFLHRWHRRIGVCASLFVIWMVLSGWLLNHTSAFNLDQHLLHSSLLAQRYGLQVEMPQQVFNADQHWLVQTADSVLLDGKKINAVLAQPVGMVSRSDMVFVADNTQLLLLTVDGGIIDKLAGSLLPIARITQMGNGCNGAVISDGEKHFVSVDGIAWSECNDAVGWSRAQALTDNQRKIIEPILQPGISLEKLLLDLHSGRFLGRFGPFFIDLVGLGLLLLALTGLWMFGHGARRRRARH